MEQVQVQVRSSRASGFTFGVELECYLSRKAIARQGIVMAHYHSGSGFLPQPFPYGWRAESDSSLQPNPTSTRGWALSDPDDSWQGIEIISPVLSGLDGIEQVVKVCGLLESMGAKVNQASAVHIHVGVESVAGQDANAQAEWLGRLLYLAAHYETALFAVTGSPARQGSHYCRTIKGWYPNEASDSKQVADSVRLASPSRKAEALQDAAGRSGLTRYHSVNVSNFFSHRGRTVEFRIFSGSTSGLKIAAWVQLVLGLAEKALVQGRYEEWDAKVVSYLNVQDPEDMLKKLLYSLGWVLGRKDPRSQVVEVFGLVVEPAKLESYRKELRRLARRFAGRSQ